MTRDEAVKYLIEPIATSTEPSEEYMKQKEAFDMAIRSLEAWDGIIKFLKEYVDYMKTRDDFCTMALNHVLKVVEKDLKEVEDDKG